MVVVDLIVRDGVIGTAEFRFGVLGRICTEKEDTAQDGLRIVKRFERLVEMDFYLLGLAEADENRLAILFLIGECSQGTFQPQDVRGEV